MQGMVSAGKEEFCAAGDRAESADLQPVAVHRIVVQHVVALKIPGIVGEIVIDREFPYLKIRSAHDVFQIHRLGIARPWVNFLWIHNIISFLFRAPVSA